ncbi:MAG: DUF6639 family protein [Sedimenticolaceae bacterium]
MKFFRDVLFSLPCFLPFLVLGNHSPGPAEEHCSSRWLNIDVNAETAGFAAKGLCKPAGWAIDQMDHCGFAIKEKLTVEVVEDLIHPCGAPVVGKFDSVEFKVQVASPSQCRQLAGREIALAEVDFDALYESIVVHEVVHAVLWKQLDRSQNESLSAIAAEYVAYAFQLSSLPESDRGNLLAAFPRAPPVDLGPFNSIALTLNPLRFATNAYRHFMSVEDPCEFLREIISGEVEFDDWDQYE